jgi:hypothetical protein
VSNGRFTAQSRLVDGEDNDEMRQQTIDAAEDRLMLKTDVHIIDRSRRVLTLARLEALMAPVKVLKRPR